MNNRPQHLTLGEYLSRVSAVVRANLSEPCWIVAELSSINKTGRGHVYLDLIESSQGKESAKARAAMFAGKANAILERWRQATGGEPQAGMRILLNVEATFNVQYGFSLKVNEIDPAYTVGDMQMKLQQSIDELKRRGWFDQQRQLSSPGLVRRIAVIAPSGAAGLADFQRDAGKLHQAGVCAFEYYPATFQGKDASESLCMALKVVHGRHQEAPFDLVCIIRGGGSKADLAWLNDAKFASWVCRFPVPIYTGIGHEIDEGLLDMVAHRKFGTPSKVIGYLRSTFQREAEGIRFTMERLTSLLQSKVVEQKHLLDTAMPAFKRLVDRAITEQQYRISSQNQLFSSQVKYLLDREGGAVRLQGDHFKHSLNRIIARENASISSLLSCFKYAADGFLATEKSKLASTVLIFNKINPITLMDKGFVMVKNAKGELIKSVAEAEAENQLTIVFKDGQLIVSPLVNN